MGSLGSDLLHRPEDEDSPEYKEYLKKLLQMQANRAQTGFSAPSSGSSDAYFAKLTRLKLEMIARRKAGLSVEDIDKSYKPEDYQQAVYENQEPLVSSGGPGLVLDAMAGGGGSGNKVRSLTKEELLMAKAAEESVRRAIEEAKAKGTYPAPAPQRDTPLPATIKGAVPPPSSLPSPPHSLPIPPAKQVQAMAKRVEAPPAPSPLPLARPAPPAPASAPAPPAPASAPAPPAPSASAPSAGGVLKRKLPREELEVVGKALEFAVKHRGGGPFGEGRLQGEEVEELERALRSAFEVLRMDGMLATPEKEVEKKKERETSTPLPSLTPLAAKPSPPPAPVASHSPPAVATPPAPISAPASAPSLAPALALSSAPTSPPSGAVPLALGLDRFLLSPRDMDGEELTALREGLIRALGRVQDEISERESRGEGPASPPTLSPPAPLASTSRIIEQYYSPSSPSPAPDSPSSSSLSPEEQKQLRLALGLLLKHRGGPGFGHGRLGGGPGGELSLLEQALRSATTILKSEAMV